MNTDLSLISLILDASLVVKAVLLMLLLVSVVSWAIIIEKSRLLKQVTGAADEFEASFWSGGDVSEIYREIAADEETHMGMAGIFESGYREFGRLKEQGFHQPRADPGRIAALHAGFADP